MGGFRPAGFPSDDYYPAGPPAQTRNRTPQAFGRMPEARASPLTFQLEETFLRQRVLQSEQAPAEGFPALRRALQRREPLILPRDP